MIPILRPKLPTADRLAPYLATIDQSRFYSNFGPQTCVFEERLSSHFGLKAGTTTTVANATLGLTLALMAQGVPRGTLCVMPGWTFVASAQAAMLAGLVPYFVDVDASQWALDPLVVEEQIIRAPTAVGAVMVTAPFGRPVNYAAWDDFNARTTLPIVIDAAGAFDSLEVGEVPAVVSLHATKVLGIGEGGFVASRNTDVIRNIRNRSNFGFAGTRSATLTAFNAKLSEYHAAVGLAALDMWRESRAAWMAVAGHYRQALAKSTWIRLQPGFGDSWVSSTCVVSVDTHVHAKTLQALTKAEIDTRMWWGGGAHRQPATITFPRGELPVTERLARSTIGLPFYPDLREDEVRHVAATMSNAVSP
jgi:dTDP-4-amino-4,6-dideoxygalactose transaminase